MGRTLDASFESWREHTKHEMSMRAKALKAVQRMTGRSTKYSFDGWRGHAKQENAFKMKALTVVQRLAGRCMASSFERWRELANDQIVCKKEQSVIHLKVAKIQWQHLYGELRARWEMWYAWAWGRRRAR